VGTVDGERILPPVQGRPGVAREPAPRGCDLAPHLLDEGLEVAFRVSLADRAGASFVTR
jgi:hypothetical protein